MCVSSGAEPRFHSRAHTNIRTRTHARMHAHTHARTHTRTHNPPPPQTHTHTCDALVVAGGGAVCKVGRRQLAQQLIQVWVCVAWRGLERDAERGSETARQCDACKRMR
jgi:hypothetical protein